MPSSLILPAASGGALAYPLTTIANAAVAVPADFLGIHTTQYPGGTGAASAAPVFPYAAIRTHDSRIGGWRALNPSSGTYSWTVLDAHVATGKKIMFTVFHTPQWAAKTADQGMTGPYGNLGECAPPQSLASLSTFITALVTRYNTAGNHGITSIEVWNEPNFYQDHTGFFWGSAAELVDMAATIRTAALAVDPTIKILGPGFILTTAIGTFLNTQGPTTGKYGREVIDGFCFHPYYNEATYQGTINRGSPFSTRLGDVKYELAQAGIPNLPVYVSEYGTGVSPTDASVAAFNSLTAAQRRTFLLRLLAIYAALGVKQCFLYSYAAVNASLCGDLVADTSGAIAALNDFSAALVGKTITSCVQSPDGTLTTTVQGGATYVW